MSQSLLSQISFSHERGDEDATRLVQRFVTLAREVLESRGGKVLEFRGNEALVVFGGARQAVCAAVELLAVDRQFSAQGLVKFPRLVDCNGGQLLERCTGCSSTLGASRRHLVPQL